MLDVELDGDADLVDVDGTVRLNDGRGRFPVFARRESATSADLDGECDHDLLAVDGANLNLPRQVSSPYLARPGHPWSIRVHVAARAAALPAAFAIPAIAFVATPPVAIPGLGVWRLDLATAQPLAPLAIPPGGSRDRSFTIPADPNLIGAVLHVQALVADPLVGLGLTGSVRAPIR